MSSISAKRVSSAANEIGEQRHRQITTLSGSRMVQPFAFRSNATALGLDSVLCSTFSRCFHFSNPAASEVRPMPFSESAASKYEPARTHSTSLAGGEDTLSVLH